MNSLIEIVMGMKSRTKVKLSTVDNKTLWIIPNELRCEGGKDFYIINGMQQEQSPCGPFNNVCFTSICVKAI